MPLNITNYINKFDYWGHLKNYLFEHYNKYNLQPETDDKRILKFLKSRGKLLVLEDTPNNYRMRKGKMRLPEEGDTYRQFIDSLKNDPPSTISRTNALRLCFTLEVDSDREANNLLRNYMGLNELSPRNLQEFIVIFALRNNYSWNDVFKELGKYHAIIDNMPTAPANLKEGATYEVYSNKLTALKTIDDLEQFLSDPKALSFFAVTRNTLYLALLEDINLRASANGIELTESSMFSPNELKEMKAGVDVSLPVLIQESRTYPIIDYHRNLFGLHSLDGDIGVNFLTDEEINALSRIYKDTFLTYDTFTKLIQRTRNVEVSAGTFLLHLLTTLGSESADPSGVDFTDKNDFLIHGLDDSLFEVGFPKLDRQNSFHALVIDSYLEVLNSNIYESSETIRKKTLYHLRYYLKQIAAYKCKRSDSQ